MIFEKLDPHSGNNIVSCIMKNTKGSKQNCYY